MFTRIFASNQRLARGFHILFRGRASTVRNCVAIARREFLLKSGAASAALGPGAGTHQLLAAASSLQMHNGICAGNSAAAACNRNTTRSAIIPDFAFRPAAITPNAPRANVVVVTARRFISTRALSNVAYQMRARTQRLVCIVDPRESFHSLPPQLHLFQ